MASTSSYNYSRNNPVYDVFLNHRGPDCKDGLAKDLYNLLIKHGLQVFLDVDELQPGLKITPQIETAIRTAQVHIAIFSPRYAESTWCLDELLWMLESGKPILPIFYRVNPSVLRWVMQSEDGEYARALHRLKNKRKSDSESRYDSNTIDKWMKALSEVAQISGFDLETFNGDERQLLQRVVEEVLKNVKMPLHVSKYPTGLNQKVEDFEGTVSLQQQNRETRVIGIVGFGGVGKTTLAKEIFNRRGSGYKHSCFLLDVREKAASNSLVSLQRNLIKDLTQIQNVQIDSREDGIEKLKRYLSSRPHALIVLDDVDCVQQLDALLSPVEDVLHQGSLIIVTSRNEDVLTNSGIVKSSIFKLTGLNEQDSRKLFCLHAFNQPCPVIEFEQEVQRFLNYCGGLPLSLKVVGALLRGQDLKYWKAQLHKISEVLPKDIGSRLKISYDCLDEWDKKMFLDVACFFIGAHRDTVVRIWDGTEGEGWLGLRNLESRCLVEVESDGCIRMHDHMRDLGRAIAEDEPEVRLWRPTHNLLHLSGKSLVRGISTVHLHGCERELTSYMSGLQLLGVEGDFVESKFMESMFSVAKSLIWLRWRRFPYSYLPSWIPLKTLRVLRIQGSELKTLWRHASQAPLQLRELSIEANDHSMEVPESIGKLEHLEKLEFISTCPLPTFPDKMLLDWLGNLLNLRHITLYNCCCLQMLPDSLGNLTNLHSIDLACCSSLQMLPDSLGNLTNLHSIDLAYCYAS